MVGQWGLQFEMSEVAPHQLYSSPQVNYKLKSLYHSGLTRLWDKSPGNSRMPQAHADRPCRPYFRCNVQGGFEFGIVITIKLKWTRHQAQRLSKQLRGPPPPNPWVRASRGATPGSMCCAA